jgi:hypothetical protein
LLVAVQVHELSVVTEIDAEPPAAGNVVVVTPVMIWHPDGAVLDFLLSHAPTESNITIESIANALREKRHVVMPFKRSTLHTSEATLPGYRDWRHLPI